MLFLGHVEVRLEMSSKRNHIVGRTEKRHSSKLRMFEVCEAFDRMVLRMVRHFMDPRQGVSNLCKDQVPTD